MTGLVHVFIWLSKPMFPNQTMKLESGAEAKQPQESRDQVSGVNSDYLLRNS